MPRPGSACDEREKCRWPWPLPIVLVVLGGVESAECSCYDDDASDLCERLDPVTFVEGYAMTETGRCAVCENTGRVSRHAPFLRMYNGTAARLSPVGREQGGA
jgi:hypothetical protein